MTGVEALNCLIGNPLLKDGTISLSKYIDRKEYIERSRKDKMTTFRVGDFKVIDKDLDGAITLGHKLGDVKVLVQRNLLEAFNIGDTFHATLRKKVFFMYWEFESFKNYVSAE